MRFVLSLCFVAMTMFSAGALSDVASGQSTYASRGCIGCHGPNGISVVATYPSLKGKTSEFIRKSLGDFRSGARKNAIMNAMAAGLKDSEIQDLGEYIGSLK